MFARVRAQLGGRAVAAVVAQVWQALGSFGLQICAAWMLGAAGLGMVSLCFGIIVLATAVVSGMVGDSLVVLDRHDRGVRAGLQFWAVAIIALSMIGTSLVLWVFGVLSQDQAIIFAIALGAFQVEELVRRVFTARLQFWRLPIIDSTAVAITLGTLGVAAWRGDVSILTFFLALALGQIAGIVVGVAMMPSDERRIVGWRHARIREVAGFGGWRGAQVGIPPMILSAVRIIVTATAGAAALGQVEAARIFVAPALLAVQGLGSYLLSSYVRDKQSGLAVLRKRAWTATAVMTACSLVAGGLLVFLLPVLGHVVTGPQFTIDRLAVIGWALYVAGTASLQPFASLAAARGRPAHVFFCRIGDGAFAITATWVVLVQLDGSVTWVPFLMAAGLFLGGFLVRTFVLRPLVVQESVDLVDARPRSSYATQ